MGCPRVERLPRRRQRHGSRLSGLEVRTLRWAQLGASRKVDFNSNGTEGLLGRVFDGSLESAGFGFERQDQPRPSACCVPGLSRPDVLARLLSLLIMSATLSAFTVLAAALGPGVLAALSALTLLTPLSALTMLVTALGPGVLAAGLYVCTLDATTLGRRMLTGFLACRS